MDVCASAVAPGDRVHLRAPVQRGRLVDAAGGVCKGFVGNNEASEENFNLGEDNPELDSCLSMQAHLAGKEYCVCNIDSRAFPCYSHHRFYSPDLN